MPDITRHSPKNENQYDVGATLGACDPIDMRLMSGAIITLISGTPGQLQPYYSNAEDGTFRKLNSQDGESNGMTIPADEGMDLHPSTFAIKWMKLLGSGAGVIQVDAKG